MILSNVATLEEIETHWSINDLADANEALDVKEEIERLESAQIQQRSKR